MRRRTLAIVISGIVVVIMITAAELPSQPSEKLSDIPSYYETDIDGNLIKPDTTDWLFDKEKPLAEIFENGPPNCEYDFAYLKDITDITVMCYEGDWYVIHSGWTDTPYRLPDKEKN